MDDIKYPNIEDCLITGTAQIGVQELVLWGMEQELKGYQRGLAKDWVQT